MKDVGFVDKVKGNVKEVAGKVVGDRELELEGVADKVTGKVKEASEKVKDAVEEVADKVKDKLNK